MAGRKKPKDVPEFRWINIVPGNLKISLSGCFHAFYFRKYAARYLAAFCYRFNRRFDLRTLHQRLLIAAASTTPSPCAKSAWLTFIANQVFKCVATGDYWLFTVGLPTVGKRVAADVFGMRI